jgi:hypothetical protein
VRQAGNRDDEYDLRFTRPITGYLVQRTMVVRLTDLSRFEAFNSALLQRGDCEVESVVPSLSNTRAHRDAARALAIRAAREKAVAIAAELGQHVGKAISITEARDIYGMMSNSSVSVNYILDDNGLFAAGQLRVQASVTVRFALD